MGWDIVFSVRFPERADPAERFRVIRQALERRAGFEGLSAFAVIEEGDYLEELARLDPVFDRATPVTDERVEDLLGEHVGRPVAFRGTWYRSGLRDGAPTRGVVTVTVFAPGLRARDQLPWPVDVLWDVGDSRRYSAQGNDGYPSVKQVVADLPMLIDLGADSIWGLDQDRILSPDHLHTVFHRDPERYRDDGVEPPFPPVPMVEHEELPPDLLRSLEDQGHALARRIQDELPDYDVEYERRP